MSPTLDRKGHGGVDDRPTIGLFGCEIGEARGDIDDRKRQRAGLDRVGLLHHRLDHPFEGFQLHGEGFGSSIGDAAFEIGKLGGGETHGTGHRLAVDEAGLRLVGRRHHIGIARRHLDEIAQHVVMLDLERLDAGLLGILQLQAGDHPTRLIAQRPHLIEFGIGALTQEAAIALQKRQIVGQHRAEHRFQPARQGFQIRKG